MEAAGVVIKLIYELHVQFDELIFLPSLPALIYLHFVILNIGAFDVWLVAFVEIHVCRASNLNFKRLIQEKKQQQRRAFWTFR